MILLDTCALIWSLFDSDQLSPAAKAALETDDSAVSIASLWEMAIKVNIGKLKLSKSITQIAELCERAKIEILPITPEECEALQQLPFLHKDPFERIIMAQAMTLAVPIVTEDEMIWKYGSVDKIW